MAKNKKNNPNKHIIFLSGIAICLFSVILIMNIGVFARILAFPLFFLIGSGSYVFYCLSYIIGFGMILNDNDFKFKHKRYITSGILIIIGVTLIATGLSVTAQNEGNFVLSFKDNIDKGFINFNTYYWNKFNAIEGGYLYSEFIYMLNPKDSLGGGYLGALIGAIFNDTIGIWANFTLGALFILGGVLIFAVPIIVKLVRKTPNKTVTIEIQEKVSSLPRENKHELYKIDEDEIEVEPNNISKKKEEVETTNNIKQKTLYNDPYIYDNNGVFIRASFNFGSRSNKEETNNKFESLTQVVNPFVKKEPVLTVQEETKEEVSTPIINEVKHVQIPLDLNLNEEVEENILPPQKEEIPPFIKEETPVISNNVYQENNSFAIQKDINIATPVTNNEVNETVNTKKEYKARLGLEFTTPSLDLLAQKRNDTSLEDNTLLAEERKLIINQAFEDYKIGAYCDDYIIGPAVTRYIIKCHPGVSVKSISNKIDDICILLGGVGARFEPVVEGQRYSGLEVPNGKTTPVTFKETFEQLPSAESHPLSVPFGVDISGNLRYADYCDFPHLLVAGTTGSGKSVYIHTIISTLIMRNSPDDLKFVLVDPKQVEMNLYQDMPHLLSPIIYEAEHCRDVLNKLLDEMDYRYSQFKKVGVVSLEKFNRVANSHGLEKLPYILIVIDEYADFVEVCKDLASPVRRLAAKARSSGIHLLIATQRPSTNVVDGVIKSNLPTHVALMTASSTDSLVVLGEGGAETLLGRGDMLVQTPLVTKKGCVRCQSPYIQEDEIEAIVNDIKSKWPTNYDPEYVSIIEAAQEAAKEASAPQISLSGLTAYDQETLDRDEILYNEIKEWTMTQDYCSMSKIQRTFSVGFNRAGKLFKRLQDDGIVANAPDSPSSAKGCKVLISAKFYNEVNVLNTNENSYDEDNSSNETNDFDF